MDDDGSGWNEVLVGGWTSAVRHRCVERVEVMTRGWRNALIRTLTAPEQVPDRWTEALHRAVLTAIEQETGADLDLLGSHAAWACYEDVWDALERRWRDGGDLPMVPLDREARVVALITSSPHHVAEAVGADITGPQPVPLWLAGRMRVDVDGLRALRDGPASLTPADLLRVETLLEFLPRR